MIDKFVDWLDDFVGKKIEIIEKEQPVVVEDKTKKKKNNNKDNEPITARKLEVGESRDHKESLPQWYRLSLRHRNIIYSHLLLSSTLQIRSRQTTHV